MTRLLLAPFVLLLACDASEPTEYVPTYDPASSEPVASTEFCSLLARNTCAVLRPCCRALPFAFDEAKCRQSSRALCEARRTRSMELGLVYDDVQAGRCVRGTAILLPECRSPTDRLASDVLEACRMVFHGGRPINASCDIRNPVECAPPRLGAYVACSGSRCVERSLLEGGESCEGRSSDCAPWLVCEGEPRRCTALYHPLGAPCSAFGSSIDRCDANRDRYCDTTASPAVCKALPGFGERCDVGRGCARPWRCDVDRAGQTTCTEAKPLGTTCNDDRECESKLCSGNPDSRIGRFCVPSGIGAPITSPGLAKLDPVDYVARIAAACSGVIPEGAGGLAPFAFPPPK